MPLSFENIFVCLFAAQTILKLFKGEHYVCIGFQGTKNINFVETFDQKFIRLCARDEQSPN